MAYYVISYDLHDPASFSAVWSKLESLGAVRILESLWLVTSIQTASQIRDELQKSVENDDALVIIELKSRSYWSCLRPKQAGVSWLKRNIAP